MNDILKNTVLELRDIFFFVFALSVMVMAALPLYIEPMAKNGNGLYGFIIWGVCLVLSAFIVSLLKASK